MKNLFGGGGAKKPVDAKAQDQQKAIETINVLDNKINELDEQINNLEVKKNNLTEVAKTKLKAGDKKGAKQALSKKKKYDDQIKQFDGAMMMMEEQKMILENMASLKSVFDAVGTANTVIKEQQSTLDIDKIDQIKDDLAVITIIHTNTNIIILGH